MAKRFSPEFKQQSIEYALANTHEPLAVIARKLGVGYSTLDKWVCAMNLAEPVNDNLHQNNNVLLNLRRKTDNSRKPVIF